MARYELPDRTKFWEITLDGTSIITRHGRVGQSGHTKLKQLETPVGAKATHAEMIADKLAQG